MSDSTKSDLRKTLDLDLHDRGSEALYFLSTEICGHRFPLRLVMLISFVKIRVVKTSCPAMASTLKSITRRRSRCGCC